MPRIQRLTSLQPFVSPLIWGLGVLALMPLVLLGGLAAVLVGLIASVTGTPRPVRHVPIAIRAPRAPEAFRGRIEEPQAAC